ncbi:MAG: PQQ-dependent sugar dehydrogenase [Pseudomonadota bacterium]
MSSGIRGFRQLFVFSACVALAACGGGGGSDPAPTPTPTPLPTLTIANVSSSEGDSGTSSLVFTVSLSATSADTVSVNYATQDGTATAGEDYQSASGTLQFLPGDRAADLSVTILGDEDVEANESFTVRLSSPVNATLAQASANGTISNDDAIATTPGLSVRPDNQTCVAPAAPEVDSAVVLVDAYPGLPDLFLPTKLLLEPVAAPRWFVLQKNGVIQTFDPDNATSLVEYLDLNDTRSVNTDSEGGLLGMAFHPDYPATPEIFLSYTIDHTGPSMRSVISRLIVDDVVSPGGGTVEQVLIEIDQDFNNHNGGDIAFGPDGRLYIGLGDGGSGNDPRRRAQDTTTLLGSMLRLEVRGTGAGYSIPTDNPFAGESPCGPGTNANNCPEIYAWGLRNPWRWSFDPETGDLWLADVGQGAREEVNIIELGGNYGWRCREGTRDTSNAGDCPNGGLIDPVTEYQHTLGNSITGGFVYRGTAIPDLAGRYVFADYGSGRLWATEADGLGGLDNDELLNSSINPTAFAVGDDSELYVVNIGGGGTGRVRRLEPGSGTSNDTIPDLLSATGCTTPSDILQPYSGLLPYDLNARFWSDNADKERYIALPNGTTITRNADDDWAFPNGTVIVKNFRIGGDLVETRHLMRHPDGSWGGYTYEWNAAQTEATRVRGGKTVMVNGQPWIYPSESQCLECHTEAAGVSLGPETAQLNKPFTYPSTGITANQLSTIDHVMMFTSPLPGPVTTLPTMADPTDTSADLGDRARAYLHTNCASCHRPNGPTPSTMDLRYTTSLASTNACDQIPLGGDQGLSNARLIAPGNAASSVLVNRMARRDSAAMPPIGSALVDDGGVALLSNWIDSLGNCN